MLFSCSSEDNLVQSTQNRSVADAKNWFESTTINKNFEILQYTKELLWDDAIVSNGDKGEVIEVPLILQENISTSTNPKIKDYHRLLFIKKENNDYETKYIQVFTADSTYNNLDKKFNYYSIKDNFNGSIYVLNSKAKSGTSSKFKKSKRIIQNITAKFNEPEEATCLYVGWSYPDGSFEPIMLLGCYGGTGGGGDLESEYFPESTGEYGGGGGGTTTTTEPVVASTETVVDVSEKIEEQIKDSLDPCPKGVLEKLKNSTNNDIAEILKKFGASKIYELNIISDSKISRPATSIPGSFGTNSYSIMISSNYTSATGLFRASNLLHEIIHCYFFSLVDTYTATNNPAIFNDFPTLFQKFVDNTYPGSRDLAHHDEMANTYVNTIALALQDYNEFNDPNGNVPFQVYTDLAWGGLQEAPIFTEKYPVGSIEYNRIVGRYNVESVNFNINGQTVVGKPCN